ncbi:MAG TPA: Ig-like domain-containing protein, partial [Gemmatimonadales bacterium]
MRLRTPAEARKVVAALRTLGAAFLYSVLLPGLLAAQAAELELTPDRLALEVGKRQPLYAAVYDRQGNLVTSASITFASSDSTVATVSADGTVTGIGNGSATVEATSGSLRATVPVTVTGGAPPVQVAAIRTEPRTLWLLPLEPARVAVHATLADGSPATGAGIRWKSSSARVATVDRDGLVVGVAPGQALVEAAAGRGAADTVLVIVDTARFSVPERITVAPGGTDTIAVLVPAQQGRRLGAGLTWSSSDSSVAAVAPGGVVRGRAAGS